MDEPQRDRLRRRARQQLDEHRECQGRDRARFWFTALRYEDDRYSGFDYQGTITTGAGYKFADTEATKLSVQLGTGYRALRPELLVRDETGAVIQRIPTESQERMLRHGGNSGAGETFSVHHGTTTFAPGRA